MGLGVGLSTFALPFWLVVAASGGDIEEADADVICKCDGSPGWDSSSSG